MKFSKFFIPIISAVFFAGCSDDVNKTSSNNDRHDIILTGRGDEIVEANNEFAFKLYGEVSDGKNNIVLSPLSLHQHLSMVANGADGDTKKEIEALIGADGMSIDDINGINYELVSSLKASDKKTKISIANSLWQCKDAGLIPSYLTTLDKYYSPEIHTMDVLSGDDTREAINRWCENMTSGVIKDFLEYNLDGTVKYVTYNATYFKSEWSTPFKSLPNEVFNNADGSTSSVDFMKADVIRCGYFENDKFTYLEIPYGNGSFVFTIVMPKGDNKIELEDIKSIEPMQEVIKISIPKFKVDYKHSMKEALKEMGMITSFSENADFSKASKDSQPLPDILHAVSIEVDEKGTVAAAVSGSGYEAIMIPESLKIDRPFTFFIKESSSSVILFIGEINKL